MVVPPRGSRGEAGVSTLELSILAPAIIALIFMSIQVALYLFGRSVALNAAQEGVSQLRIIRPQVYTAALGERVRSDVETYAGYVGGTSLQNPQVPPVGYDANAGTVTVTVTGNTVSLLPGITFKVSRTATGTIETFQADK